MRGSQVHAVHSFGHPEPPVENIGWGDPFVQCIHVKHGQVRRSKVAVETSQIVIMKDQDSDSQCSEACRTAVAWVPPKDPG